MPAAKETVTARMARWAAALEYKQLSNDAVYQAKRFLLDSVGCALGGYQQHDVKIALEVLDEVAGRGPATIIGTGKKVDAVSASTFLPVPMIVAGPRPATSSRTSSAIFTSCCW